MESIFKSSLIGSIYLPKSVFRAQSNVIDDVFLANKMSGFLPFIISPRNAPP